MEMLNALKKQWKEKLGGKNEAAEHGGFRPVQTRELTPFPTKTFRPARRCLIGETLPTGAACFEEPTIMAHGKSLAAEAAADTALTTTFEEPHLLTSHGATRRPLAAAAAAGAAPTLTFKAPQLLTSRGALAAAAWSTADKAALGLINSAPTSCNAEPHLLTSIGKLSAAPCGALIAAVPRSSKSHPTPNPLTENSMEDDDDELGHSFTTPSPPRSAPQSADAWESSPPVMAATKVNVQNGDTVPMVPNLTAAAPRTGRVDAPATVDSIPAIATDREGGLVASAILPPRRNIAETVHAAAGVHGPMPSTGIFIGNVPLHTHGSDFSCDKFAASFNNSTRKTLSYVKPSIQNGEIVVRPSIDVVREGSRRWDNTAVGYFLGRKPYYHHLNEYVRSVWPAVKTVTATSNGFYFFQFKTEIAMEEVIEGGPWLFQGQPIVLQRWEPGMVLRKHKHTQVPVWIRLRHLPVEFWTNEGLSTVASGSDGHCIKIPSLGHARDWISLVFV
ncbi:hypothetical protein Sango_3090200 [Sesamum angolense]|uniref:DUF4283 domain-containing protein n=1 Tax=Sesamum angolense TaxID=2727404 RepID=A0AAE1T8U0_9LAMI|nr:hypothetical protein Sango_3090200 [Sesamum angolense]